MRYLIVPAIVVLLVSCKKKEYTCPQNKLLIKKCLSNFGTANTNTSYHIDTAYIAGDSVVYTIKAPPEYKCANLEFCTNEIDEIDSLPPIVYFSNIIYSEWSGPELVNTQFSYDITFLRELFDEDSVGLRFKSDTWHWFVFYRL